MKNEASYIDFILAGTSMPVLAGMKPAGLIGINKEKAVKRELMEEKLGGVSACYGICCEQIYENDRIMYLFLYKERLLKGVLCDTGTGKLLMRNAYETGRGLGYYVQELKKRLHSYYTGGGAFPHELGLFLGYPPADVEAYIRQDGRGYVLDGYWKVYYGVDRARALFRQYKYLQQSALEFVRSGNEIEGYKYNLAEIKSD